MSRSVFVTSSVPVERPRAAKSDTGSVVDQSVLFGSAISVMKCALSLDEPGQEVTLKVLDLTHLINYPVSATTQAGSVVHKVFHRPRLKAEKSPRRGSSLCSVASRLAGACANPDPPRESGAAGGVPFPSIDKSCATKRF
jgi:hypothetical protein